MRLRIQFCLHKLMARTHTHEESNSCVISVLLSTYNPSRITRSTWGPAIVYTKWCGAPNGWGNEWVAGARVVLLKYYNTGSRDTSFSLKINFPLIRTALCLSRCAFSSCTFSRSFIHTLLHSSSVRAFIILVQDFTVSQMRDTTKCDGKKITNTRKLVVRPFAD